MRLNLSVCFIFLFFASAALAAPLGTAITYQGQLRFNDDLASGLFDIQICLFDDLSEPIPLDCVMSDMVPVEEGVFTVELDFGDMAFVGDERYIELRVRPGGDPGGFIALSPRQLVTPSPEALNASFSASAPWGGLTNVPAGFADNLDNEGVTDITAGAGLAGGMITSSGTISVAPQGIEQSMLALNAVGSDQIEDNAVTAAELADNAVDTDAIIDANVTREKIAPGAIGIDEIDPTIIQVRVEGMCGEGEFLRGITADGDVVCELLPVAFDRVIALATPGLGTGITGDNTDVKVRSDDRPIVAFYDNSTLELRLFSCADQSCSNGVLRTLDSAGDVGQYVTMALR